MRARTRSSSVPAETRWNTRQTDTSECVIRKLQYAAIDWYRENVAIHGGDAHQQSRGHQNNSSHDQAITNVRERIVRNSLIINMVTLHSRLRSVRCQCHRPNKKYSSLLENGLVLPVLLKGARPKRPYTAMRARRPLARIP